ncbi:hypothetical protein [Spirosoma flavum]|uniref:hypothetical protein n=1 Tax=Spirosoma flavum TaxID=2048557 RepID=UPI0036D2B8B3
MFLSFTTIDNLACSRDFSWWFSSIETAMDVLSSISLKGNQLTRAELIDNDQRTQLPVKVFDGSNFSVQIQQLESEWQQALISALPISTASAVSLDPILVKITGIIPKVAASVRT